METYALNVGEDKRRGIPIACAQSFVSFSRSWHRSLVSAEQRQAMTYSYDMFKGIVAISRCKSNHHWTSGVGNSHTVCRVGEDWPIQPQKATSVRLNQTTKRCYATKTLNRARSSNVGSPEVCMWLGLSHRQAKHNEKTLELMGSLTPCEDTKEM